MKFSFIQLIRFRGNARVFQQVSMNLNMTVGQAACRAHWLRLAFTESYRLLRVNQAKELVAVRV